MVLRALASCIAEQKQVTVVDVPQIKLEVLEKPVSGAREYLQSLEELHKSLILFLWLSYRFIGVFKDRDMAVHAKEIAEDRINTCLLEFSANPELRKRVLAYKKRMSIPDIAIGGNSTTVTTPSNLDLPGAEDSALPVDWTRGSSEVEFEEAQPIQHSIATHG